MRRNNRDSHFQVDADLYSTNILQELIESTKEWKEVDDIIKLTFKAVTDILQTHAQGLKDLKAVITTRASKTELSTGLSLKSNISDVSKAVQELSQAIEEKATYTEINTILRDYATRADLTEVLAERTIEKHSNNQEKQNVQITILKGRMDQFQREIIKRVGACVTLGDFQQIQKELENKANINEINEALQNKVSKQYLTTALQKKISRNDFDSVLAKKADTADLQYLVNSLQSKVSVATLDKLTQVLQNKADKSDVLVAANERSSHNRSQQRQLEEEWTDRLQQTRNTLALQIKELKRDFHEDIREHENGLSVFRKEVDNQFKKISNGLDIELVKKMSKLKLELNEEVDNLRLNFKGLQQELQSRHKVISNITNDINLRKRGEENIYAQIDDVRKKIEEYACKTVDKKEFIDFKSQLVQLTENKVEIQDIQNALDKFEGQINAKMGADKNQFLQLLKNTQNHFKESLNITNSQTGELRKFLSRKQDRNDSGGVEDTLRKFRKEVEDCRKTVDVAYNQIHSKISIKQYQTDLMQIRKRFEVMGKEVLLKANIKDVCVLADSKPNIDDVNKALNQINDALADKITQADLQSIVKDQAIINESLCSENILGRWSWQSGQLKPGGLIPWEGESANTVPDHFFWEKDKTSILIITAGIYEVTVCIFSKGSIISVLANGEQININKGEENVSVLNKKARKRKDKEIGGNCVREFVMLPSRSRVSVTCAGDIGEGFLNIRRV